VGSKPSCTSAQPKSGHTFHTSTQPATATDITFKWCRVTHWLYSLSTRGERKESVSAFCATTASLSPTAASSALLNRWGPPPAGHNGRPQLSLGGKAAAAACLSPRLGTAKTFRNFGCVKYWQQQQPQQHQHQQSKACIARSAPECGSWPGGSCRTAAAAALLLAPCNVPGGGKAEELGPLWSSSDDDPEARLGSGKASAAPGVPS
jgi:hypothetical protein